MTFLLCLSVVQTAKHIFGEKLRFRNLVKIIKKELSTMFTAFGNHVLYMFKDFSGKSRIGEASYRGEGMGQIVLGEI